MAVTRGVLALLEAKPGKGADLASFLERGRAIAAAEQGTVTWYAFKLEASTYGIFDTFENAENSTIQLVSRNDTLNDRYGSLGFMKWVMNSGTSKAWEFIYRQANNADSMPFVSSDHFMDVLWDGGTPGVSPPTHTLYASMAMTPTTTFDLTNGKIAYLTEH